MNNKELQISTGMDESLLQNPTSWKFYLNSEEAWEAMLQEMDVATESIDLEQYIFCLDSIGERFVEMCKKKAMEGIKVRLFCDEVGSFDLFRSKEPDEMRKLGIEVKFFNSVIPWSKNTESLWYFRDHRKLLVIDKKVGFTGGACIAIDMKSWRESHVRVEGEVVSQMSKAFDEMWNKEYRKPGFYFQKKRQLQENKEFQYITNTPLPRKRYMYYELIQAVRKAKEKIYFTTPYFLPDHKLTRAIKGARKRGVEVNILVPERPNHTVVHHAARTYFEEFLRIGVRIFLYGDMIHSKTLIIDDNWSSIGSLNLDNLSLRYNFEANIVTSNRDFGLELKKQFLDDLNISKEVKLSDWKKRPFSDRLLEMIVWPLRKIL